MVKITPEERRTQKYSYYIKDSPLNKSLNESQVRKLVMGRSSQPKITRDFILDGVHENVHKSNVVPSYNAHNDRHAQTYFRNPAVQDMLKRAAMRGTGQLIIPPAVEYKLSNRRRIPCTPGLQDRVKRENRFIMDSIKVDSIKSRRNPVIPQYDAMNDMHAQNYFKKRSVKSLLVKTCQLNI